MKINLVISGTFNTRAIAKSISMQAKESGSLETILVNEVGINQIQQALINPKPYLLESSEVFNVFVANIRIEDLFPEPLQNFLLGIEDATRLDDFVKSYFERLSEHYRLSGFQKLIVHVPIPNLWPKAGAKTYRVREVYERLRKLEVNICQLDLPVGTEVVFGSSYMSVNQIDFDFDFRGELLHSQPITHGLSKQIAHELMLRASVSPKQQKKVIVVDGDNTLWGGILGEDGTFGVQIGREFPGNAFRHFQQELKSLKDQGFLLALASKNNLRDVQELFEDRKGDMVLQMSDFTILKINWEKKSENIEQIALTLNVSLDSIVFMDDSKHELAEVKGAYPQVLVVEIPSNPEDLPGICARLELMNSRPLTQEDRDRTSMYANEVDRKALKGKSTYEDYLLELGLELEVRNASLNDLERIEQLFTRTNQFNLVTHRYQAKDLATLHASDNNRIVVANLRDSFGDYGLIGVLIIQDFEPESIKITDWALSCRALGKSIEDEFLFRVCEKITSTLSPTEILISYRPTIKNEPARNFLERILGQKLPILQDENAEKVFDFAIDCNNIHPVSAIKVVSRL